MTDDSNDAESVFESRLTRILIAWVGGVRERARGVLIATALFTVGCIAFTATHIGINTSHTALLSDELPFWREYMEYAEVFPILDEALLVVVDADSPLAARDATELLAARLREMPDRFSAIFVPGGGDFFERSALLYLSVEELEELSDQLASVQPILAALAKDDSLRKLASLIEKGIEQAQRGESNLIDLDGVFDSISIAARSVLEGRPRGVSWLDHLSGGSLGEKGATAKGSRRLIVLHPVFDYSALLPGQRPMQAVRDATAELRLADDFGARVRITGNVALNTEEMVTVAEQAILAAVGSLILVALLLAAALRSRRLVAVIVTTLLTGLVWTGAFAAAAVGSLNVVSIAFAVLFIGLGVDFGIHLGMRYAELMRSGESHADALAETARSVGSSLVLCAATTSIGFFVFVPTDYQAVAELGLISGVGMLISLFCSLTVMPALLSVGAERWAQQGDFGTEWAGAAFFERALAAAALRHPRRVMWVAVLVGVGAFAAIPWIHFDHNVVAMRDSRTESAQTFDELLADSDTSPWSIDLIAPNLAAADDLAKRLGELDFVARAVTLRDYVPTDQADKLEILADVAYFVPRPRESGDGASPVSKTDIEEQIEALRGLKDLLSGAWVSGGNTKRAASAQRASREIARFLAHLETVDRRSDAVESLQRSLTGDMSTQLERLWNSLSATEVTLETLPDDLVRQMLAEDGRARVQVLPSYNLADNAEHVRFVDGVRAIVPEATGSAVSLLEWARVVVRSFQQALVSAVFAVAVTLWLLWRRLGDMVLVLFPLLLAAGTTAGLSAVFGISFNFANVIVVPLLLGIGVDSGVHMVHRFREGSARVDASGNAESAGRGLLGTSTAQAVFFSALTTIASFGSLALSAHVGFSSLGRLLVIGVALTLLCNLVLLPALIVRRSA